MTSKVFVGFDCLEVLNPGVLEALGALMFVLDVCARR